ncbi:MAG: hypothetical protein A2X86_07300 [Bdellovibrionales bacterium GWA2_49_15]|nr:MAG: hypothetical protein A2X86_07300 [Bdellovibrionales bacterium GWA2_49_15]HAZ11917.1 hypothetical protein [Bdellovibrionales bacterium]
MAEIFEHLEKALKEYSSGDFYPMVLEAKKEYTILTGQINDDDDDYENRVNAFNDWYVLQYIIPEFKFTVIEEYARKHGLPDELVKAYTNINHSLFQYGGETFKKVKVVKDYLHHGHKLTLSNDSPTPGLLKGDLFTGRLLDYKGERFLLSGLCILPKEMVGQLVSEARKVQRTGSREFETNFLMKLEYFKTKWTRYSHLPPERIFQFMG